MRLAGREGLELPRERELSGRNRPRVPATTRLRCFVLGHSDGAPFRDRKTGRVHVRCGECGRVSTGMAVAATA